MQSVCGSNLFGTSYPVMINRRKLSKIVTCKLKLFPTQSFVITASSNSLTTFSVRLCEYH